MAPLGTLSVEYTARTTTPGWEVLEQTGENERTLIALCTTPESAKRIRAALLKAKAD